MDDHREAPLTPARIRELGFWIAEADEAVLGSELSDVLGPTADDLVGAARALAIRQRARALRLVASAKGRLESVELDPRLDSEREGRLVRLAAGELARFCDALVDEINGTPSRPGL